MNPFRRIFIMQSSAVAAVSMGSASRAQPSADVCSGSAQQANGAPVLRSGVQPIKACRGHRTLRRCHLHPAQRRSEGRQAGLHRFFQQNGQALRQRRQGQARRVQTHAGRRRLGHRALSTHLPRMAWRDCLDRLAPARVYCRFGLFGARSRLLRTPSPSRSPRFQRPRLNCQRLSRSTQFGCT